MRDRRSTPFFYITIGAAETLRSAFPLKPRGQRTAALAIYAAMCEVANEQRSNSFSAPRKLIADYAGVSPRTLDDYVPRIVAAGLVSVERRQEGGVHMPHEWSLIDVQPPATQQSETTLGCGGGELASPLAQPARYWRSDCEGVANSLLEGGEANSPHARARNEEVKEVEEPPNPQALNGGGAPLTAVPGSGAVPGRRRERERLAAEQRAWLDAHPATPQLQDFVAPILDAAADRIDQGTFAIWLASLHAHDVTPDRIVMGTPHDAVAWVESRFGPLLAELAGRQIRVIGCACPEFAARSEAVA